MRLEVHFVTVYSLVKNELTLNIKIVGPDLLLSEKIKKDFHEPVWYIQISVPIFRFLKKISNATKLFQSSPFENFINIVLYSFLSKFIKNKITISASIELDVYLRMWHKAGYENSLLFSKDQLMKKRDWLFAWSH